MSNPRPTFRERWRARFSKPITRERVLRFLRSRTSAVFDRLVGAEQSPPGTHFDYPAWLDTRIAARRDLYTAKPDPHLFTIMTPVYDTPPQFLRELARSVFAQDFPFQWAVSDDGSTNPETLEVVAEIRQDPRVTYVRLDKNCGITAATRAAFDISTGRYVVPVDADDLIYPDALRVLATGLEAAGWPVFAYSDEDKVHEDSRPHSPFFKPDWDPVLFLNCCYIAHLCAIDRQAAAAANVYSDYEARGCPDLDTFARLLSTGKVPLHIPEILYSWRIHAGSTASTQHRAKPYSIACQKHVWSKHLARLAPPEKVELRANPLFRNVGMWYPARKHVQPAEVHAFVHAEDSPEQLRRCLVSLVGDIPYPRLNVTVLGLLTDEHERVVRALSNLLPDRAVRTDAADRGLVQYLRDHLPQLSPNSMVAIISDRLRMVRSDWAWEAQGVFDVHADAAVCTPRLLEQNGLVASAGEHFGFGGVVGPADIGRSPHDPGYHGWVYCQRTVGAASSDLCVARTDFLSRALADLPDSASRLLLGAWLGALADRLGQRVVYAPFIAAQYAEPRQTLPQPTRAEVFDFLWRHKDLVQYDRFYPRFFQLQSGLGFCIARPDERAAVLNPVLSQLEGPANFYDEIELAYDQYPAAQCGRYQAEPQALRQTESDAGQRQSRRAA